MAQKQAPVEVNSFNVGLVTDANPLNAPQNSALDCDNIVFNRNGLSARRLGMDYETNHAIINNYS